MAEILYPDGRREITAPANGTNFTLAELQHIVEGYIEIVPTRDGRIMILNEEGKLLDLPRNEQATRLAALPSVKDTARALAENPDIIFIGDLEAEEEDYIAGTVLVCDDREVQ